MYLICKECYRSIIEIMWLTCKHQLPKKITMKYQIVTLRDNNKEHKVIFNITFFISLFKKI